jgi:hypothetical protein
VWPTANKLYVSRTIPVVLHLGTLLYGRMPSITEIDSDDEVNLIVQGNHPPQVPAYQGSPSATSVSQYSKKVQLHAESKPYSKARMIELRRRLPELPPGVVASGLSAGLRWYQENLASEEQMGGKAIAAGVYYRCTVCSH